MCCTLFLTMCRSGWHLKRLQVNLRQLKMFWAMKRMRWLSLQPGRQAFTGNLTGHHHHHHGQHSSPPAPHPSKFRSKLKQRLYLVRCTHSATIQDTGVAPALVTGAVEAQSQRPAEGLSQCDADRGFRAAPVWSGAVTGRSRQQLPGRGCGPPHGQQATVGRLDEQELVRSRVFHVR
jgi:hypothetical protein